MKAGINIAGVMTADTITKLPPEAAGAVLISGSHGGVYPGYLSAKAGARAVILNDASIGKDQAGIGSLNYLEGLGIAAATVSYLSCRIGDTGDMAARGMISHANAVARACGVGSGTSCAEAARRLTLAPLVNVTPPSVAKGRGEVDVAGGRHIILIDSAAMVRPHDAGQIVVTGSHGGLVGGKLAMALRVHAFAAVFNDAGIGIDQAGITRLPALDMHSIASFTVSAGSARIGDARSTFEDGVISHANETALRFGAAVGVRARDVLLRWSE